MHIVNKFYCTLWKLHLMRKIRYFWDPNENREFLVFIEEDESER